MLAFVRNIVPPAATATPTCGAQAAVEGTIAIQRLTARKEKKSCKTVVSYSADVEPAFVERVLQDPSVTICF